MSWSDGAFEDVGEVWDFDECFGAWGGGVDGFDVGVEDEVGLFGGAHVDVFFEGAGIFVEVFMGAELCGVDEDGDDDVVGEFFGFFDEAEVSLVEGAHGGDAGDFFALLSGLGDGESDGVDVGGGLDHGGTFPFRN